MSIQPSAATPDVDKHYYSDGLRWETAVYRSAVGSRNIWRTISVLLGVALILALATLYALLPLKSLEVVTLLVDKTTGFVEVARPLEAGGELTQRESVTRANIVRFVRARETYDPKGLRDNFDMASLYSAGVAAKDLQAEFATSNPSNPMKKWGPETTISVFVKSVIFLNERTAAIRFQTTRKSERETRRDRLGRQCPLPLHVRTHAQRLAFRQSARASRCSNIGAIRKPSAPRRNPRHEDTTLQYLSWGFSCAGAANAETAPRALKADERIRSVVFKKDNVVFLEGTMGVSTMIVFDDEETIATVAMGDSLSWQAVPDQSKHYLFIKPLERDAVTNMNVVTNKRIYNFVLRDGPPWRARERSTSCALSIPTRMRTRACWPRRRTWPPCPIWPLSSAIPNSSTSTMASRVRF